MPLVKLEFLGGLDQIFNNVRQQKIQAPTDATLGDLLPLITDQLLANKADYDVFIQEETVRPGILVLINDTDWELEGKEEYVLEDGDVITFTSTLHGG